MKRWTGMLVLTLFFLDPVSAIQPIKSFKPGSLAQITSERQGQAFVMLLWSVDCPPCLKEMSVLQQMRGQLNQQNMVLISADGADARGEAQAILQDFQLEHLDNWIFSDTLPERLRYQIDPGWYGELPRAYFYSSDHQRRAHSGVIDEKILAAWLH